jgi:hypothetical protein
MSCANTNIFRTNFKFSAGSATGQRLCIRQLAVHHRFCSTSLFVHNIDMHQPITSLKLPGYRR